ncbi:MAG: DUF1049 domain-containing protein [Erythrobacter sp.]
MQIVRTLVWALILFGLLAFSFFNWDSVEVTLWDNLVLETKIPALVIISFLLGLLPMWMIHRGVKWRLNRRITSLESAARSSALSRHEPASSPAAATPAPTPTPTPEPDPAAINDTLKP